jgi:hypothetical protein
MNLGINNPTPAPTESSVQVEVPLSFYTFETWNLERNERVAADLDIPLAASNFRTLGEYVRPNVAYRRGDAIALLEQLNGDHGISFSIESRPLNQEERRQWLGQESMRIVTLNGPLDNPWKISLKGKELLNSDPCDNMLVEAVLTIPSERAERIPSER